MESDSAKVIDHYEHSNLLERLKNALVTAGLGERTLAPGDLAALDQFHLRGLKATIELAEALKLKPGMTIVDIGSGLGGPSRYLASKYGCRVRGVDLSPAYVEASNFLAERCGLNELATYECANALSLPLENDNFDIAWTQHVAMNIADRAKLYAEAFRVLRSGGRFAFYDVLSGDNGAIYFPVPWSRTQETSFLLTENETRDVLEAAGFRVAEWLNRTEDAISWLAELKTKLQSEAETPALGLHVVMGPEFPGMAANLARNIQEGKTVVVEAIFEKP